MIDWFASLGDSITGGAAASTQPNITLSDVNAVIVNISYQSGLDLTSNVPTNFIFSFLAMDANGAQEFDNTSAFMNVSVGDGGDTRENNTAGDAVTCYPETVGSNLTAQNYTCTIALEHWDLSGDWNCTAHVGSGIDAGSRTNVTLLVPNCFTVNTVTAFNMTNSSAGIAWPTLSNDNTNQLSTDELNITNTGNVNLTNVTITAINLIGETTNTQWIPAENFTAAWVENSCDYGIYLTNSTPLEVIVNGTTGGTINPCPPTAAQSTSVNNATIYLCLEHVGTAEQISGQSYSTAGAIDDWAITAGTGAV